MISCQLRIAIWWLTFFFSKSSLPKAGQARAKVRGSGRVTSRRDARQDVTPNNAAHPCKREPKSASRKHHPHHLPSPPQPAHRVPSPSRQLTMFSPEASFHGVHGSARNPRRRQRHDSDSAKHQPERKRSKISPTTFVDPSNAPKSIRASPAVNGHAVNGGELKNNPIRNEIPVREKKPSGPLARKIDGASILVGNSALGSRFTG